MSDDDIRSYAIARDEIEGNLATIQWMGDDARTGDRRRHLTEAFTALEMEARRGSGLTADIETEGGQNRQTEDWVGLKWDAKNANIVATLTKQLPPPASALKDGPFQVS